jgi:ADP-heptose:LPS heptosyltransferase
MSERKAKRILLIRIGRLGDSIMATSPIDPLRAAYGTNVEIDYASGPGASAAILRLDCRINRVFPIHRRRAPWRVNRGKRELRNHAADNPYDLVINLESGPECDDFAGFVTCNEFLGRPHSYPDMDKGLHAVEMEQSIWSSMGGPVNVQLAEPRLVPVSVPGRNRQEPGSGPIIINPGFSGLGKANYRGHKAWPQSHWQEFIEIMSKRHGFSIAVNGTREEALLLKELVAMPDVISLLGSSLDQLVDAIQDARCVVSVDTGTMHLAAALGTPTIALFGPTSPKRTGPWSGTTQVKTLHLDLDCQPCLGTELRKRCTLNRCMGELPVQSVVETCLSALKRDVLRSRRPGMAGRDPTT